MQLTISCKLCSWKPNLWLHFWLLSVIITMTSNKQTNCITQIRFLLLLFFPGSSAKMTDGSKHKTVVWTKCVSNGAASQHFINFSSTFHWTVKRHDFDTTNQSCYAMLLPENSPFDSTVYKLTTPVSLFFHVIILKDNDDTSLKHR